MSTQLQLAAAERLRGQLAIVNVITGATVKMADGKAVAGWKPIERHRWQRLKDQTASQRQQCLTTVKAVSVEPGKVG